MNIYSYLLQLVCIFFMISNDKNDHFYLCCDVHIRVNITIGATPMVQKLPTPHEEFNYSLVIAIPVLVSWLTN